MPRKKTIAYEASLSQLEALVTSMESGELSLEDSLQAFESGVGLIRDCQQALENAEQKVQKLMETEEGLEVADFDVDEDGE